MQHPLKTYVENNSTVLYVTYSSHLAEGTVKAIGEDLGYKWDPTTQSMVDGDKRIYGRAPNGSLMGLRFDMIYINTPIRPDASRKEREMFKDWMEDTLVRKLKNPKEGRIIIDDYQYWGPGML